jgi:hypothetical protein
MDIPLFAAKLALKDSKTLDKVVAQADEAAAYALDSLPRPKPRFEAVFVNGEHMIRDRRFWYNSHGPFATAKAANAAIGRMA